MTMQEIGGYGLQITLRASVTFPIGITLTQFADDADPFDSASIQLADKAMGLNGDLITWSKAVPLPAVLNLIPNGDDDNNMGILAEANRVGKGKRSVKDIITMVVSYPDGRTVTYAPGKLTDAMLGNSVASSARMKSKPYVFAFENKVG